MKQAKRKARRDYVCDICGRCIDKNEIHAVLLIHNHITNKEALVKERYHEDCAPELKQTLSP